MHTKATLDQLIARIRFELEQLSARNGQHEFEHLCCQLARSRICSNILPATGPVAAGGDQGRDFESFRTYLRASPISDSGFIGLISEEPVVFACTLTGKKNIPKKVKSDVATIMASGEPVIDIHFFCTSDLPVAQRHKLKKWAKDQHKVQIEIHDGQAISEYLADNDLFWLAEQYLSIPADLYPPSPTGKDEWYQELLQSWKSSDRSADNYADFAQIKSATRHATFAGAHQLELCPTK